MNQQEKNKLFDCINYMNMSELKEFCNCIGIPYKICVENAERKLQKTSELDRKGIVIARIKAYAKTGKISRPTIFSLAVLSPSNKLPALLKSDHLVLYGEYKNGNDKILKLMQQLTKGEFAFGAIAQEIIRSCWTRGKAPTYAKFAKLWLTAKKLHTQPNPEWAFLADKHHGDADLDWKKIRIKKAKNAIKILNSLRKL